MALALGLPVACVEIFIENNSGGTDIAARSRSSTGRSDRNLRCRDKRKRHVRGPEPDQLAELGDEVRVSNLVAELTEAEGDDLREKGDQRAWGLLKDHASSVEEIAAQLLAQRKIDLTGYVLKPEAAPTTRAGSSQRKETRHR